MEHVHALALWGLRVRCLARRRPTRRARSVIYIFLSGGLAQHDSFDLKPDAPDDIRGEFKPIATRTPGIQICEHLPLLAQRSHLWALVPLADAPVERPLARPPHHAHRPDRTLPPGFDPTQPQADRLAVDRRDRRRPSRAARNNLPPAVVLPERLVHNTGRVIPGQFAGVMGRTRDPWFIEASPFEPDAPTAPIPSTSSTTRSGRYSPQAASVPGPEPDAARGLRPRPARRPAATCSSASTGSAARPGRGRPTSSSSTATARRPSRC